jgi:hypothetical protein
MTHRTSIDTGGGFKVAQFSVAIVTFAECGLQKKGPYTDRFPLPNQLRKVHLVRAKLLPGCQSLVAINLGRFCERCRRCK